MSCIRLAASRSRVLIASQVVLPLVSTEMAAQMGSRLENMCAWVCRGLELSPPRFPNPQNVRSPSCSYFPPCTHLLVGRCQTQDFHARQRSLPGEAYHNPFFWFPLTLHAQHIPHGTFVAPSAVVAGDVEVRTQQHTPLPHLTSSFISQLGLDVAVWYNAVIRGDKNKVERYFDTHFWTSMVLILVQIVVQREVSIGDRAALLTVESLDSGFPAVLTVESEAIIKPGATLVSCTVQEGAIIGENAVVLEGVSNP